MKRLLFVLLLLVAALLALEAGYRIDAQASRTKRVVPIAVGTFDAALGWKLRPGAKASSLASGELVRYEINSQGLRDDEVAYKKPDSTFRIVLLGDSNTFGFGINLGEHFSKLLENSEDHLEVVNLGVSGYGVDQMLLQLQAEGFRYDPDLVIAYVPFFSDHRHMHKKRWGKNKPVFKLNGDQLQLENSPVPRHRGRSALRRRLEFLEQTAKRVLNTLRAHLPARLRYRKFHTAYETMKINNRKNNRDKQFVTRMLELGGRLIFEMHQACAERDIPFLVVTLKQEVRTALEPYDMLHLHLTSKLETPEFMLPNNLRHLNAKGNAMLTEEIHQYLRQKQLLPAPRGE